MRADRAAIHLATSTEGRVLKCLSRMAVRRRHLDASVSKHFYTCVSATLRERGCCMAYVAYALPTLTRHQRASSARVEIITHFTAKQQAFLDFVLTHYVSEGVQELDQGKLTPLLRLKYNSIADAVADLGRPEEIGDMFAGFQRYLYQGVA